jgi:hypothetical protein
MTWMRGVHVQCKREFWKGTNCNAEIVGEDAEKTQALLQEISGECEDYGLLGFDAVYFG